MKVYQELHGASIALQNCENSGNTLWAEKWESHIARIMQWAPSGSGLDAGTKLQKVTPARMVFQTAFHHMSEHGYYDGWTDHLVTIRPDFVGFNIAISGRDRNQIKDYIADVFYDFLNQYVSSINGYDSETGEGFTIGNIRDAA